MALPAAVALGILIAYAIACAAALVGWMNPERSQRRAIRERNRRHHAAMEAFIRDYYDRQDDGR